MWALAVFAAVAAAALAAYGMNNLTPRRVLPGLAALSESDERILTGSTKTSSVPGHVVSLQVLSVRADVVL